MDDDSNKENESDNPAGAARAKNDTTTLYYNKLGLAGSLEIDGPIIFVEDLDKGLAKIPADMNNAKSESMRKRRNWVLAKYGPVLVFIPAGLALVGKNNLTRWKKANQIILKLDDLFDGGKCLLLRKNLQRMAAY